MMYGIDSNTGEKIRAKHNKKAVCPICGEELIPKCGRIKVWHWAHKKGTDCDEWYEPETDWHRFWKSLVPKEWCEQVIKKNGEIHRADILTPTGLVIELQHSPISPDEIEEREEFYENMIWLFDCRGKTFEKWGGSWCKMKYPKKHIAYCNKPTYLQYNEEIHEITEYNYEGEYDLIKNYNPLSWFNKITGLLINPAAAHKYYINMGLSGYPNITLHDKNEREGTWGIYISEKVWNEECEVWDDTIILKKSYTQYIEKLELKLKSHHAIKPTIQYPQHPSPPEKPNYNPPDDSDIIHTKLIQTFENVAKKDNALYKHWWIEIFRAFENQAPNSHVEQGGEIIGNQVVLYVRYNGYLPRVKEEKYTLNSARDIIKAITKHNLNGVYSRLIDELSNSEEWLNIARKLQKEYEDKYDKEVAKWKKDFDLILRNYHQLLDKRELEFQASYEKWSKKRDEIYYGINKTPLELLNKFKNDVFKKYKYDTYINKKWIIGKNGIDKRNEFVFVTLCRKR